MPLTAATEDRLIPLRGGFAAKTSTMVWLIERSWTLQFKVEDGRLVVRPGHAITDDDDRFIRAHRDELLACVAYCDEQARRPL